MHLRNLVADLFHLHHRVEEFNLHHLAHLVYVEAQAEPAEIIQRDAVVPDRAAPAPAC